MQLIQGHKLSYELVASWTVELGDLDQALHLWRYTGGFAAIDNCKKVLNQDPVSNNHQTIDIERDCGSRAPVHQAFLLSKLMSSTYLLSSIDLVVLNLIFYKLSSGKLP